MADPITVYDHSDCAGHIITVFQDFTSTGGTKAETFTLNAGYPSFDLSKQQPIISMFHLPTENNTVLTDTPEVYNVNDEIARGTAPDSVLEFDIEGYMSFKFYTTGDANGTLMITYWAAGSKAL